MHIARHWEAPDGGDVSIEDTVCAGLRVRTALSHNTIGFVDQHRHLPPEARIRARELLEKVANFLFKIPFQEDEDPGIAYALQVSVPVAEFDPVELASGFEAHGGAEGVMGDAATLDENSHVIGPALYREINLGNGVVLEPRVAALFGLTDGSPDAVPSFNVELKF